MKLLLSFIFSFALFGSAYSQPPPAIKIGDLEKMIAEAKGPLVVNFWATWCRPCVEEIPYFLEEVKRWNKSHGPEDSVALWLVSLDFRENYPAGLDSFVRARNYDTRILWMDETNADHFCPRISPHWYGALPATLFYNPRTGYRYFQEAAVPQKELVRQLELMQPK